MAERKIYIGRCPQCGAINAASLAGFDDAETVFEFVNSGLVVSSVISERVDLRHCEHCKEASDGA